MQLTGLSSGHRGTVLCPHLGRGSALRHTRGEITEPSRRINRGDPHRSGPRSPLEADVELGWNASLLYHLSSQVELLLEFNGERVFGGEESGHSTAAIAPGVKLAPMRDQNLMIGVGVGLPISNDEDFDALVVFSVMYHF